MIDKAGLANVSVPVIRLKRLLAVVEAADRLCIALDLGDKLTQTNRQEELEEALAALEGDV